MRTKRVLGVSLALAMLLGMVPGMVQTALADDDADTYGMTIAEYAEGIWSVVDWNAMLAIYADNYVYYAENGSVNIADSWDDEFVASTYTLEGDALTLVDEDGTTVELTRAAD